jgi:hypothetical protein
MAQRIESFKDSYLIRIVYNFFSINVLFYFFIIQITKITYLCIF